MTLAGGGFDTTLTKYAVLVGAAAAIAAAAVAATAGDDRCLRLD